MADIVCDSFDVFKYSRGSSEDMPPWSVQLHARAPVNFLSACNVAKTGNFANKMASSFFLQFFLQLLLMNLLIFCISK